MDSPRPEYTAELLRHFGALAQVGRTSRDVGVIGLGRPDTRTTAVVPDMLLLAGDRLLSADEGDLAVVPPELPHAFAAAQVSDADLLIVITPGIKHGSTDPYLSVKGVRDIASGLVALILLAAAVPHLLGGFMLAASIIPIGDAIIVLRRNGPKATAYGVDAATAAVMLAAAAFLFS
jgi:hypothetical protein